MKDFWQRDDGHLAAGRGAVEGGRDGGAAVGYAVAEAAEVGWQHRLAVAQVFSEFGLGDVLLQDQQVINAGRMDAVLSKVAHNGAGSCGIAPT